MWYLRHDHDAIIDVFVVCIAHNFDITAPQMKMWILLCGWCACEWQIVLKIAASNSLRWLLLVISRVCVCIWECAQNSLVRMNNNKMSNNSNSDWRKDQFLYHFQLKHGVCYLAASGWPEKWLCASWIIGSNCQSMIGRSVVGSFVRVCALQRERIFLMSDRAHEIFESFH